MVKGYNPRVTRVPTSTCLFASTCLLMRNLCCLSGVTDTSHRPGSLGKVGIRYNRRGRDCIEGLIISSPEPGYKVTDNRKKILYWLTFSDKYIDVFKTSGGCAERRTMGIAGSIALISAANSEPVLPPRMWSAITRVTGVRLKELSASSAFVAVRTPNPARSRISFRR